MDIMNQRATFLLALLSVLTVISGAQSQSNGQAGPQATQMRQYWVDPTTGLMWESKDNGKDVTWKNAAKYCRDLRLGGYSDWRLATIDELQSLVVKITPASERSGSTETLHLNVGRHVRGDLALTGDPWSSDRDNNRFGHPYGEGKYFNFITSKPSSDLPYFRNTKYALCVRRP